MTGRKKHNAPQSYASILVLILIIVATITVGVLAKYISRFISAYKEADTAEFYFLTDLAENSEATPYPVYDGTITFKVKNYDLLNISENNIVYTVSVESAPDGNTSKIFIAGVEKSFGTLSKNAQNSNDIAISVSKDGIYKVTATSNTPYAKTITLYFKVNTHYADSFYTVTKHDGWIELDLYTGESGDDVELEYGSLKPDNTIDLTKTWTAAEHKGTLTGLAPYSHYKLIFFGTYAGDTHPFELTQNTKILKKEA